MSDQNGSKRRQVLTAAASVTGLGVLGRVVADQNDLTELSSESRSASDARLSNSLGDREPAVEWSHSYYTPTQGPPQYSTPREEAQILVKSVVSTSDGGFMLAGNQVHNEETDDFVLLRTNSDGTKQWIRTYDGGNRDVVESLLQVDDGGYLLVGEHDQKHEHTPTGETPDSPTVKRPWAVRTGADGADQWRVEPGDNEPGKLADCEQTTLGVFVAVGWVDDSSGHAAWLLKFDDSGNVLLDKRYNTEDDGPNRTPTMGSRPSYRDRFKAVVEASDGDLLLGGAGNQGGWVLRTDSAGATRWQTYLGSQRTTVDDLVETAEGNIVVTGQFWKQEGDNLQTDTRDGSLLYVTLLNSTGAEQWTTTYDGRYNEVGRAIIPTADGGYAVAGTSQQHGDELFVVKTTGDGTERWRAEIPGWRFQNGGKDLVQTADGGYAIAARDRFLKLEGGFTTAIEISSETMTSTTTATETTTTTSSTGTSTSGGGQDDGGDCPTGTETNTSG